MVDFKFRKSVPWLLGPQLIGGLRRIISYQFLRKRLDQRNWMTASVHDEFPEKAPADGFWWDYIADTGDGELAMYNLAALLYADLYPAAVQDRKDGKLRLTWEGDARQRLPRGQFLVVGGDTAYHVADRPTLAAQFQAPFQLAWKQRTVPDDARRPLFGVPGNHDYYDEIEGFQYQFRAPGLPEPGSPLELPGFQREQQASYFAIRLPEDWWFWGLDNEIGHLDDRQIRFFNNLGAKATTKLIVATPEPTTVNGIWADPHGHHAKAFSDLSLARPFLRKPEPLAPGQCRVDLSGDTHNYQRYFGPAESGGVATYASVVSGGGGAFLHPTSVDFGQVERATEYPDGETARRQIGSRNLQLSRIVRGGWLTIIGGLIAAIIYIAATFVPTSHAMFARVLDTLFGLDDPPGGPSDEYLRGLGILAVAIAAVYLIFRVSRYAHALDTRNASTSIQRFRVATPIVFSTVIAHWAAIAWLGDAPARYVLANVLSATLALSLLIGLVILAVVMGASDHGPWQKVGFAFIGLLHGTLQLFLPLILMRILSWQAFATQIAIGLAFWVAGNFAIRKRGLLVFLWVLFCAAQLVLPRLVAGPEVHTPHGAWVIVACAGALGVGYVSTAVGLGWYFAVCLDLNGHGNEAASVARVSDHKQFIRFKIDSNGALTGYVIALDRLDPGLDKLEVHVADQFTVQPARR